MRVLLYIATGLEIAGFLTLLAKADKPREEITGLSLFLYAAMVLVIGIPLTWTLLNPHTAVVRILAAFVLAVTVSGVGQTIRLVHGAAGPKTPLGAFIGALLSLASVLCLASILALT